MAREPFEIGGVRIAPGDHAYVDLPISKLSDHTPMRLAVQVLHGKQDGPTVFISAAIHGDEIIGVEIIRRLSVLKVLQKLRGTLILVPVVNSFGFISWSRYLPDRRDLNRSFPGSPRGSLAGQLAHIMMSEIVSRSDVGIDLHSGAIHRPNLPQIRAALDDPETLDLARAFAAPVMLNSKLRDGSLRMAALENDCRMLLYEAGEALRFDDSAIRIGVRGILNVLRQLAMLPHKPRDGAEPIRATSSHWLRSPVGGIARTRYRLGSRVEAGDTIAVIADPLGRSEQPLKARDTGVIIGLSNLPVVNRGDALFHVAIVEGAREAQRHIEDSEQDALADPLYDDDLD
ncbi:succinylglutamate desuccinylase/aspartoacylase family protein [Sphingomicrobium lutaoense]|uniref:Succinylglutamate desuccinylase/Aspartoacylase catalytic domain-containing protein n=1 Tax=Sphingomicrobium lutaoense TaxID=515949 RepID=A0A839YXN9_9SPHN|nr:succinylglutamate desuccinylase/aspartoacylase family protein [Sphingomicrobium lutaoense]MBB3763796.1 hypothetical protein [Sphingomicrobium lutaoense]